MKSKCFGAKICALGLSVFMILGGCAGYVIRPQEPSSGGTGITLPPPTDTDDNNNNDTNNGETEDNQGGEDNADGDNQSGKNPNDNDNQGEEDNSNEDNNGAPSNGNDNTDPSDDDNSGEKEPTPPKLGDYFHRSAGKLYTSYDLGERLIWSEDATELELLTLADNILQGLAHVYGYGLKEATPFVPQGTEITEDFLDFHNANHYFYGLIYPESALVFDNDDIDVLSQSLSFEDVINGGKQYNLSFGGWSPHNRQNTSWLMSIPMNQDVVSIYPEEYSDKFAVDLAELLNQELNGASANSLSAEIIKSTIYQYVIGTDLITQDNALATSLEKDWGFCISDDTRHYKAYDVIIPAIIEHALAQNIPSTQNSIIVLENIATEIPQTITYTIAPDYILIDGELKEFGESHLVLSHIDNLTQVILVFESHASAEQVILGLGE